MTEYSPVPYTINAIPESVEILSLELITLTVKSIEAETVRGVRVTVSGTCQVKVDAFTQQDLAQNLPQITLACQHFLGKVRPIGVDEATTVGGLSTRLLSSCETAPKSPSKNISSHVDFTSAYVAAERRYLVGRIGTCELFTHTRLYPPLRTAPFAPSNADNASFQSEDQVHQALLKTLEGHQRQILGTLTVEELYKVSCSEV